MAYTFLSYSRRDEQRVLDICAELDQRGLSYWRDRRDIPVSVPWLEEVHGAIRAAALFVACDSYDWFESRPCQLELFAAERFGKPITHIDVHTQHPIEVVDQIAATLSRQTVVDHAHTELLVRSAAWNSVSRKTHDLAGNLLLRRLRKAETRPLTSEARAYLDASRRRNRRARLLSGGGAVLLIVAFLVIQVFVGAQQKAEEQFATSAQELNDITEVHNATETNVYAGLQAASANVRAGRDGFLGLTVLQEALDIPVPDWSAEQTGPAPVGFRAGMVGTTPIVVNAAGAVSDASLGWPAPVTSVATSADGAVAVAMTADWPVALLDGAPAEMPCAGGAAAVSWSGTTVATLDRGQICVWRPRAGTRQRWPVGDVDGGVLAVSDDHVVLGSRSGLTTFTAAGKQIVSEQGVAIERVEMSPDGGRFAITWVGHNEVEIRQTATSMLYRRIVTGALVRAVRFSPDGRTLATSYGISVRLWDIATGQAKVWLRGNSGAVRELAWSMDGTRVWAIAGESRVTSWRWRLGTGLYDDPNTWFVALSAPGSGGTLIATTQSGALLTIDPTVNTVTPLAQTSATKVITASVDADHQHVALAAADTLTVHDIHLNTDRTVPLDDCLPISVAFVPNSTLLMVACLQADLRTIDTATGRAVATMDLPYGGASAVAVAPGGDVYATGMTGLLYRTEPQLGGKQDIERSPFGPNVWQKIAISGDGDVIMLVGDGTGRVGRMTIGRRAAGGTWEWYMVDLPTRPGLQARAAAVNHDGTVAAIGLSDGTVHYWLPRDSNPGRTYTEVSGAVRGMTFTGNGTSVVAVTRDGVADLLPGCPSCGVGSALATEAEKRLDEADRMGLMER